MRIFGGYVLIICGTCVGKKESVINNTLWVTLLLRVAAHVTPVPSCYIINRTRGLWKIMSTSDVAASLKEVSKLGYDALELAMEQIKKDKLADIENFTYCLKELKKIKGKIPARTKGSDSKTESDSDKWNRIQERINNGITLAERSGNEFEINVMLNVYPLNETSSSEAILDYHGHLMGIEKSSNMLTLISRYLRGQIYTLLAK